MASRTATPRLIALESDWGDDAPPPIGQQYPPGNLRLGGLCLFARQQSAVIILADLIELILIDFDIVIRVIRFLAAPFQQRIQDRNNCSEAHGGDGYPYHHDRVSPPSSSFDNWARSSVLSFSGMSAPVDSGVRRRRNQIVMLPMAIAKIRAGPNQST